MENEPIIFIASGIILLAVFLGLMELGFSGWGSPNIAIDALASAGVVGSFACGIALLIRGVELVVGLVSESDLE